MIEDGHLIIRDQNLGNLSQLLQKTCEGSKKTFRENELQWLEFLFDNDLSHFVVNANEPHVDANASFYYIGP